MKRIFLLAFAIVLSFGVFAQQNTESKDSISIPPNLQNHTEYLKRDGRMYIIKEGGKTELTNNVILGNETVITTMGQVKNSDGSIVILNDGQFVNEKGEVGEWKDQ
ncbi:MAG: DUF6799 domain-containing protein [Ginsengibacter sp.]